MSDDMNMVIDLNELGGDNLYTIEEGTRVIAEITEVKFKKGMDKKTGTKPWYLLDIRSEVTEDDVENAGKRVKFTVFLGKTNPMLEKILSWNDQEMPVDGDGKLQLQPLLETLVGCRFGAEVAHEKYVSKKDTVDRVTGETIPGEEKEYTNNVVKEGTLFEPSFDVVPY